MQEQPLCHASMLCICLPFIQVLITAVLKEAKSCGKGHYLDGQLSICSVPCQSTCPLHPVKVTDGWHNRNILWRLLHTWGHGIDMVPPETGPVTPRKLDSPPTYLVYGQWTSMADIQFSDKSKHDDGSSVVMVTRQKARPSSVRVHSCCQSRKHSIAVHTRWFFLCSVNFISLLYKMSFWVDWINGKISDVR